MSGSDPVQVRCVVWLGDKSGVCGAVYSTALDNFTRQQNRCPCCGGYQAQRVDAKPEEPPPFTESES